MHILRSSMFYMWNLVLEADRLKVLELKYEVGTEILSEVFKYVIN